MICITYKTRIEKNLKIIYQIKFTKFTRDEILEKLKYPTKENTFLNKLVFYKKLYMCLTAK